MGRVVRLILRIVFLPVFLLAFCLLFLVGLIYRREDDLLPADGDKSTVTVNQILDEHDDKERLRGNGMYWPQDLSPTDRVADVASAFDRQESDVVPMVPLDVWAAQRKQRRR